MIVRKTLKKLSKKYPYIDYMVVLAYMPGKKTDFYYEDNSKTMLLEFLEKLPPKYAIPRRNCWMIEQSDMLVTYVKYLTGGAAKFKALAEKKGKAVINIPDKY